MSPSAAALCRPPPQCALSVMRPQRLPPHPSRLPALPALTPVPAAAGRVAAMELARDGVRVNSISPGATATPIFWGGSPGHVRGKTLSAADNAVRQAKVEKNIVDNVVPLRIGRSGTGYDIATTALFLASDDAQWITGQNIIVDGGMTTFDAPNKGWMADSPPVDPVPNRKRRSKM